MPPRGREDKRRHGRVAERLTLQSTSGALGTIELETANLSLGGAYCLSSQAIPPMTRLHLNIFLPSTDGRGARLHYPIEVDAVVVRSEKLDGEAPAAGSNGRPHSGAYRLALFFAAMADGDREHLARFLSARAEA